MGTLLVTTSFLLADARTSERTFEVLNDEGAFTRLVDLIASPKEDDEVAVHRLLMELLYEMSRIQKISLDDLGGRTIIPGLMKGLLTSVQHMSAMISYNVSLIS